MKMQTSINSGYFMVSLRTSLFICIIAFLFTHQYDSKWNLPILAWYILKFFAGKGWGCLLSVFITLCWLYLWVSLIQGPVLNSKLITAFIGLYSAAIFASYCEITIYSGLGHLNEHVVLHIFPFLIFIISSVVFFFKQLKSKSNPEGG